MIDFIKKKEIFKIKEGQLYQRLKKDILFPRKVFSESFEYIIAFEFDWRVHEIFYNGLVNFLKKINQNDFTFFILNPSPDNYYYKHFGVYGMGILSANSTYKEYLDFFNKSLLKDNIESGEDFEVACNDIAYFSDDSTWCMYGARNWEVAIIAFKNAEIGNIFLDSFGEDRDIFLSLSDRIEELDDMFNFSAKAAKEYSLLLSNYSSLKSLL